MPWHPGAHSGTLFVVQGRGNRHSKDRKEGIMRTWAVLVSLTVFGVAAASTASAGDFTILVANKDTAAFEAAGKLADDAAVFAESRLHKALDRAAELIGANPDAVVNVKLAAGEYAGKGGAGGFTFPEVIAPGATLRLLGGYDDAFKVRAPFDTPTILRCGASAFDMQGKKHALKEFVISGLMTDVAGSNSYDEKTNSLLKGSSAGLPIFCFGYLTTNRFVIADCLFMNSSQFASAPLIRAASKEATVVIRNNFILNNVHAWLIDSARFKDIPVTYTFEGNSVIMNWPYNPDPTTGNPAAIEIAGKYAAGKVVIKDNLFAHNFGGALYPTAADNVGTTVEIKHNLFFDNGYLFGLADPKSGAVVGKFGAFLNRDVPWCVLDIDTVEEDYSWDTSDNVVLDPKVPITLAKPGLANSGSVEAEKNVVNDVRELLGRNLEGGKVAIKDFAPRLAIDPKLLPFPTEPKAEPFGVRRDRVEQY
jgi:hypothetical protein